MQLANMIAIDGPAGSGKSTLGKRLADCLDYLYVDTGVMYRGVTWAALQRNVPIEDELRISDLAEQIEIEFRPLSKQDGRWFDILVDGQDITWEIRRPEVEARVSEVSAYPRVRRALTALQRRIGLKGKVVMVGRDIGTVVLPEADLKLYLVATAEERARRRFEELRERGEPADLQVILKAIRARDEFDTNRPLAPLRPAADAVMIDSNALDADQVLQKVLELFPDCQL